MKYGIDAMVKDLESKLKDANNIGTTMHKTGIPENKRYDLNDLLKKAKTTFYDTERAIISNTVYAMLSKAEKEAKNGIDPDKTINVITTIAEDYKKITGGNWSWLNRDELTSQVHLIRAEYRASKGDINSSIDELGKIQTTDTYKRNVYGIVPQSQIDRVLNIAKEEHSSKMSSGSDTDPSVAMIYKNMAKVHADDLWAQAKKETTNTQKTKKETFSNNATIETAVLNVAAHPA